MSFCSSEHAKCCGVYAAARIDYHDERIELQTRVCWVRKLRFRYYGDGPADLLFARVFPAERTERGRRSLAYVADREARGAGSDGT